MRPSRARWRFEQALVAELPRVNLIVAWGRNRVIGRAGTLPWHLPADLRHFRATTMGHPIVMGRRTWESIGRALPGRRNIVVTRNRAWSAPGCDSAGGLAPALALCAGQPEVFIIGGAQLFAEALPLARRLFLTEIDADFEGDTFFPPFDRAGWRESAREHLAPEPGRAFALDFVTLENTNQEQPRRASHAT
jgi:dihydrofolate reductase